MGKVALIIVLGGDLVKSTEHMGIAYIAACLREEQHIVDIVEINDISNKKAVQELLENQYDVYGFTTTCITLKYALELSKIIKEADPKGLIIYGGHMATFSGEDILKNYNQVDCIIKGEGELTFCDLMNCLEMQGDLATIEGIIYRDLKDNVINNEDRELIEDLDTLPFPVRDQFLQHNQNLQYIRLSTSRGCYGNCAFCSSFVGRKQKGPRWRGRSPRNVVDEIEYLVKEYNFHTFDFVDSSFEDVGKAGKQRIKEIAEEIIRRGLPIYYNCCFRAESWHQEDAQLLEQLIKSGLEKVNIGFESGNDNGLKILNKNAKMKDNWNTVKLFRKFPDIYITFGFIMFHPYSSMEDVYDNATFLYETGIGQVIRHYFWVLEVYPGTLMEQKLLQDGLTLKEYDFLDGMYKYRFKDEKIEKLVKQSRKFLELQSVWDYEIFDIIIHTFITRLLRQYKGTDIAKVVTDFQDFVTKQRLEIAGFNYAFFRKFYDQEEGYNIEAEKVRLDEFINKKMALISNEQFIAGRKIIYMGGELVNR
ncbi:MAG TPA: radical SAM protein [Lachnospiraceae bacterium]|uniref:B12-binding domain-containing radical SAM protein n=1 Tax=Anaerosporobacter sp. TaxID=1872529 RepID=UPI000EE56CAA|nr:radical SAM protein [Anaerosporobacter sp.]HAB62454.1 radical SAM protein [Lachnospiraceae bacterium]